MKNKNSESPKQAYLFPGPPYERLPYGAANRALAHVPAKKKRYVEDKLANTLTWTNGKLTVRIDKCGKPLSDEAQRLLDFLGLSLDEEDQATMVKIPFKKYAEFRGDKGRIESQRLRKKVIEALEIILNTHMTWVNEKKKDVLRANILGSYVEMDESKKYIQVNFTPEYAYYVRNSYDMPLDTRLGKLDGRNPNLYKIGRKLNEHYWLATNQQAGTHDRISIKSLLKDAPDIPSFEEVRDKYDRAYKRLIIEPLEKCLDALVAAGILSEWTWWKKDNTPLTDEELARYDYDTLITCKAHFHYTAPLAELPN